MADQRKRFFAEVEYLVSNTVKEQEVHMSGRVPSLDEYYEFRFGTIGMDNWLTLIE